ncbi:4'-phosphopantetheinyl transferase superfamily protein [Streptomyces sp. NPDC089919]|uniref:4'-phosphopantetheinyl transferase family protein n=1 Tax=Streptomyces sp. NPDC089919 TaxID=3155188 RepID=UPI00341CC721
MISSVLRAEPLVAGESPAGGAVALWEVDTTAGRLGGHPVDDALLDAEERDRAASFRFPELGHRYRAAHVALRLLLGAYLDRAPAAVIFVREPCPGCGEPHGRPAVAGGGLHFSLSHSGTVALLGFAQVPVGVDVEALPGAEVTEDLLRTVHPREQAELTALPAGARPAAMGRLWARKEAYLKGTGLGLAGGMAEPYLGCGPLPAAVPGWTLYDAPCPAGYAAAVSVAAPADRAGGPPPGD